MIFLIVYLVLNKGFSDIKRFPYSPSPLAEDKVYLISFQLQTTNSIINGLIESAPEVIIVGTGVNGMLRPAPGLAELLSEKEIELIPLPNQKAVERFNKLSSEKKVGACFHLTC